MNEKAHSGFTVDIQAIYAKGDAPKREQVSAAANVSMEGFFTSVDMIADAMATTMVGDVSCKALTLPPESIPAEEGPC